MQTLKVRIGSEYECQFAHESGRCARRRGGNCYAEAPLRTGACDALAHDAGLPGAARDRWGDRAVASSVLLGRNRQCERAAMAESASAVVARYRAHGLRIRPARRKRLEPISAFRGGLAGCRHRAAVRALGIFLRTLPAQPAAREVGSFGDV